jgi:hypothetical protein
MASSKAAIPIGSGSSEQSGKLYRFQKNLSAKVLPSIPSYLKAQPVSNGTAAGTQFLIYFSIFFFLFNI